ncbi:hypothetical protein MH215_19175 [Paenibacillus sp. ACRSA]|uniref:hypothetical protein n=1 Tax=Paenibacillus sp. ACRSA TaxID=2918211 RepID=UPI001EF5389B|nr:hypothetical protein [Paenibacillus sp. ACRSA]MCG7379141.1 hypothetical protein [Paenibacillus sp. ACRSA]
MSYLTIYPRARLNLIMMLLLGVILFIIFHINQEGFSKYFILFLMAVTFTNIIITIRRLLSAKPSITLGADDVISTKNRRYEASQIECVYINYKRIGIKLYGRRLVPADLCFYFDSSQENAGLEELYEWAARNQKEVKNKFFQTLT